MTVALALLLGAILTGWLVPRGLGRMDLKRRDPLLLIVCWLLSIAGVIFAAVAGVVLLLVPDHGHIGSLVATMHHCWAALRHGSPPRVEQLGGMLVGGVLAVLAARLFVIGVGGYRSRARSRREHLAVLRLAGRVDEGSPTTLWLAHDRPLAFSLTGRPGVVVATEGLSRHLPAASVMAVLTHERAHLRGRHHLLVALTDSLGTALSFVPLFRDAPAAMRQLVELAADVSAVRTCGVTAVRSALVGISQHDAPGVALAMARDAVDVRLERLHRTSSVPRGVRRGLSCGIAGMFAAVIPLLSALSLLIATGLVTCPIVG
jgi:Zn-dependent protease with chaperone function